MSNPIEREKPLILVVDDDPTVLRLIEAMVKRAGMDTTLAESAARAAQVLKTTRPLPNLMVLDLMLPDVSGLEFLRQLRSKPIFDTMPVMILSALADPAQIREGLSMGADRYLTKPYLANNLIPTIQDLLRTGRVKR